MNYTQRRALQAQKAVNPFITGYIKERDSFVQSIDSVGRVQMIKHFTADECQAALQLEGIQDTVRKAVARRLRVLGIRACRHCGCTQDHACEGGCWWISIDVCSSCQIKP